MSKKVLNEEELEKVTGGKGFIKGGAHILSGKISTSEAYQRVGQNLFLESPCQAQGRIYAKLNSCYESYTLWWSFTHYRMTIISVDWYANEYGYYPEQEIDVCSSRYSLYTDCSDYDY